MIHSIEPNLVLDQVERFISSPWLFRWIWWIFPRENLRLLAVDHAWLWTFTVHDISLADQT